METAGDSLHMLSGSLRLEISEEFLPCCGIVTADPLPMGIIHTLLSFKDTMC